MLPDDRGATCISLASEEKKKKKPAEHHQPILGQLFNSVNIPGSSALRTLKT